MARYRHLSKPPAKEALVDLRFESPVALDAIDRFVDSVSDSYGKKMDLWEAVFGLDADGRTATQAGPNVTGRRLESAHGLYVLQCRTSGFTLSRLSPYGEWKELREEARRLWESFRGVVEPVTVTRIAVRYSTSSRYRYRLVTSKSI
ncbi:TIGR04255 family protein [Trinickia mobilis]|uniref:TIGR04255 family protein n=1 Tax=Trinickia mobilis TaxID=2816356 RepID=UPI001A8DE623